MNKIQTILMQFNDEFIKLAEDIEDIKEQLRLIKQKQEVNKN